MLKGYTDKTAIENYMLVDIDDSFNDQVDEWIEAIEEYIDHETGRDFTPADEEAATEDRTFDGDGTAILAIDPAIEVEEVRFSETGDPIAAENYYTTPVRKDTTTGIKLKHLVFPRGEQNVYIKANWGYAAVPKDIKFAATVLVAGIIQNSWQAEGEVQSVTIGRYSVTYKNQSQINDFNRVSEILQYNKRYTF